MLAHSLRDAGTTRQLAVLVTLDSVSAEVIAQLKVVKLVNCPGPLFYCSIAMLIMCFVLFRPFTIILSLSLGYGMIGQPICT